MDFHTRYKYNLKTDLLGKGGFARVYRAWDNVLDRTVALKIFNTETSARYDLISEIKKAIKLEHPNLCRFHDVAIINETNRWGEEEKLQIGIMEYIDGGDLKTYCKANPGHFKKLLKDVLLGLAYLHDNGIIHRDLKPENILVKNTPNGPVAKLADFGISKDTANSLGQSSRLAGTPEFMAPEQFNPADYGINGKIGNNLDLWSFGVMVYGMVAGKPLFKGSFEEVMPAILRREDLQPRLMGLPHPYGRLLSRCLVKDARHRAQGATELIGLLEEPATEIPSPQKPPVPKPMPRPQITPEPKQEPRLPTPPAPVRKEIKVANEPVSDTVTGRTPADTIDKRKLIVRTIPPAKRKSKAGVTIVVILVTVFLALVGYNYALQNNAGASPSFANDPDTLGIDKDDSLKVYKETKPLGPKPAHPKQDSPKTAAEPGNKAQDKPAPGAYDYTGKFHAGLAVVSKNKKYGFIDKDGKLVIPLEYSDADNFNDGLARVMLNGQYGLINTQGEIVLPIVYDDINSPGDGLRIVTLNQKSGAVDNTGQLVVPIKYDYISTFRDGTAQAFIGATGFYIDKHGNTK